MTTTVRDMNALSDRLDALAGRLEQEHNVELPRERREATDATMLANLDRRQEALKQAFTTHGDAKKAFLAAKAAYKVNPSEMDKQYAAALGLAADLEAVLDFRTTGDSGTSKTDDKAKANAEKSDEGEKESKDAKKDDKDKTADGTSTTDDKAKTDSDKEKDKAKKSDEGDTPETNRVLAAIAKLGEDCARQHTELGQRIDALEPRLIRPELAKIINGRTPEQLAAALNGYGVTPQQAAFLEALVARFSTVDEFVALLDVRDAGFLDRFRFAFGNPGNNRHADDDTPSTPTRGGSHR